MFISILRQVFDTLGAPVIVPVILFIMGKFMKVPTKKAFTSALCAGVGLQGFNMMISAYSSVLSPVINNMITKSGIMLPVYDVGWQAASVVGYATEIGLMFFVVCVILQLVLYAVKFTNIFHAGDLWNNYSYMLWGSMCFVITKNYVLSFGLMLILLLITMLCAEVMSRRWSNYFKIPNCTLANLHDCSTIPFALAFNWIFDKFKLYKIKIDPKTLNKKLGAFGDPMAMGFVIGLLIGIIGNWTDLGTFSTWKSVSSCAIATAAVMAIFPRIASIFSGAFAALTEASKTSLKASDDEWYLGVNDACGYGETANLTSAIICMPILLLIAFVAPGNMVLPVLSLPSLAYGTQSFTAVSNGNIPKTVISTVIYRTIGLYCCSITAAAMTSVAVGAGMELAAGAMMITAFGLMGHAVPTLVFLAFISQNPLWIGLVLVVYVVSFVLFKKNKASVLDYIERQALNPEGI